MKASQIEDAIEQGLTPPTYIYTISGHSDDIVMVEGDHVTKGGEEFYPENGQVVLIVTGDEVSGQILVRLIGDQWAVGIAPIEDDAPFPAAAMLTVHRYSAVLTLASPVPLTFTQKQ